MGSIFACQSTPKESWPMKYEQNWNQIYQAKRTKRQLEKEKSTIQDERLKELLTKQINNLDKIIKQLKNNSKDNNRIYRKQKKKHQIQNIIAPYLDMSYELSEDAQAEVDKIIEQINDEIALELKFKIMPSIPTV